MKRIYLEMTARQIFLRHRRELKQPREFTFTKRSRDMIAAAGGRDLLPVDEWSGWALSTSRVRVDDRSTPSNQAERR